MSKEKINKIDPKEIWDGYYLDDSKMPSPEEVAAFPPTPELDKQVSKEIDELVRELGLYD
jgi:hypothetical protein